MGPRLVEALHATTAAKQMLRRSGSKAIADECITAAQQFELIMRDHDVEEAGHPADRAIAVECRHRLGGQLRLEPHRSAMASPARFHAD